MSTLRTDIRTGQPDVQKTEITLLDRVTITELRAAQIKQLQALNHYIFNEDRIINNTETDGLMIFGAYLDGKLIGFKVGYPTSNSRFYSAKGCVDVPYRRAGVGRKLMMAMMATVYRNGYQTFFYHTFPNKGAGMLILGLTSGFTITDTRFDTQYNDYLIELTVNLDDFFNAGLMEH